MKYRLKKITKTMIYEASKQFSGLELPKCKDCNFRSHRTAAWLEFSGYKIYMDIHLGTVFLIIHGLENEPVKKPSFEWLYEHNMLQEVA